MENTNFMDKIRTFFFGIKQDPPSNDFRNPIWSSDDEDDGDELYSRTDQPNLNDMLDVHQDFSRQVQDMLRSFSSMFGDIKTFVYDSPFDSFTSISPLPPEHGGPENFNGGNIRDYYLKPGYHNTPREQKKQDLDLDGKISSNEISGLLKKKKEPQNVAPIAPFDGDLVQGRAFCQTIITTSVTMPDGTVETRRIVKNGNDVVEETVTSTSTGTDTRMLPNTPEE